MTGASKIQVRQTGVRLTLRRMYRLSPRLPGVTGFERTRLKAVAGMVEAVA